MPWHFFPMNTDLITILRDDHIDAVAGFHLKLIRRLERTNALSVEEEPQIGHVCLNGLCMLLEERPERSVGVDNIAVVIPCLSEDLNRNVLRIGSSSDGSSKGDGSGRGDGSSRGDGGGRGDDNGRGGGSWGGGGRGLSGENRHLELLESISGMAACRRRRRCARRSRHGCRDCDHCRRHRSR